MSWLLLLATMATIAAQIQAQQQPLQLARENLVDKDLVTLPLIPHREQQRRRQRQRQRERRTPQNGNAMQQRDSTRRTYIPPSQRRRASALPSSSSATSQVIDALYQGYGTHYVDLWCGTPTPQRQTVIVDTGSGVTAFPCLGCQNCGADGQHIDQVYNQSTSRSFSKLTCNKCQKGHCHAGHKECQLGMTYQEGSSWSAFEAMDTCYAGGPHDVPLTKASSGTSLVDDVVDPRLARSFAFSMTFGCQTHLTGLFQTQLADGIMGMDNADTAFWYQMYQARKIRRRQFSLCYSRQTTAERRGTNAGAMTLGGSDSRLHSSPMVYSTLTPDTSGWYSVHVRRVYLQTSSAENNSDGTTTTSTAAVVVPLNVTERDWNVGNTIVDSGTTSTYLTSLSLAYWNSIWQDVTGRSYFDTTTPVKLTREEFNQLPTVLFQLKGDDNMNSQLLLHNYTTSNEAGITGLATLIDPEHPLDVILAIPPAHYMEYDEVNDEYLASIVIMDPKEHNGNVLGANTIMGHDVLFDVDNGLVGWAPSDCDYAQLLLSAHVAASSPPPHHGHGNLISHVATDTCDTLACRSPIIAGLVGVLIVGLCIGRSMGRARSRPGGYQLGTLSELELSHNLSKATTLESNFVQYRDDPSATEHTPRNGADPVAELS